MRYRTLLNVLVPCVAIALTAGCSTTSQQGSASEQALASAARMVAGTSLIGAKGATKNDQDAIDDTVAGLCGVGAWTKSECARHGKATAQ